MPKGVYIRKTRAQAAATKKQLTRTQANILDAARASQVDKRGYKIGNRSKRKHLREGATMRTNFDADMLKESLKEGMRHRKQQKGVLVVDSLSALGKAIVDTSLEAHGIKLDVGDKVNPKHYQPKPDFLGPDGEVFQTYHVVQMFGLNFFTGNAFKYISRHGKKEGENQIDELKKARWYIDKEIARLEILGLILS